MMMTGTCEWEEALFWIADECADFYDEDGNLMTPDEVVDECNECIGFCAEADINDCSGAIDCICLNCPNIC